MTSLKVDVPEPRASDAIKASSWSQFEQYRNCPKSWQLSRLRRAKRRPGPWLPFGTAVHELCARYLTSKAAEGK